jgi:hypothetical protein
MNEALGLWRTLRESVHSAGDSEHDGGFSEEGAVMYKTPQAMWLVNAPKSGASKQSSAFPCNKNHCGSRRHMKGSLWR